MLEIPDEAPDQRRGDAVGSDAATAVSGPAQTNLAAPLRELEPGTQVGRYIVLRELGRGGMALVYTAYDSELDRQVALKIMAPRFAEDVDRTGVNRLLREAQAMARLSHPNVVGVFDVGEIDGRVFIAMELIRGQTLRRWARAEPRTWKQIRRVLVDAGRGLAHAHEGGLVHRDFKPDNVLVGEDGRVVVLDFGVARAVPQDVDPGVSRVAGTASYMAPEQQAGRVPTPAADQYAFCVTAFELVFGEHPLASKRKTGPFRVSLPGAPAGLDKMLRRGLAIDPEQRWPDIATLLAALEHDPRRTRRRRLLVGGAAATLAVGASATFLAVGSRGELAARRCDAGAERLARVWNDGVRAELREAFGRSPLAFAPLAWTRTEDTTSTWAERWTDQWEDTCHATHVQRTQSQADLELRVACLDRALDELSAFATLLSVADEDVIKHSVQAAHRLSDARGCADLTALRSAEAVPDDPTRRDAVLEARRTLIRADISLGGGDFAGARDLAEEVSATADDLAFAPLQAEAALTLGRAQARLGDIDGARQQLERAVLRAEAGGHDLVEASAWIELTALIGHAPAWHADAANWARHAAAWVERLDHRPVIEAAYRSAEGRLAAARGEHRVALAHHRAAIRLYEANRDPSDPRLARAERAVADELLILGELTEATTAYDAVVRRLTGELGPGHPDVGLALVGWARARLAAGDVESARPAHIRALASLESALGAQHPDVADALNALARAEVAAGDPDAALNHAGRALDIWVAARGESNVLVARAWSSIGLAHDARGEEMHAAAAFDRAMGIRMSTHPEYHLAVADAHHERGAHDLRFGELDEAERHLMRAYGTRSTILDLEHPATVTTELELARLHLRRGDVTAAAEAAKHARARLTTVFQPQHPSVALAAVVEALSRFALEGRAASERDLWAATDHTWEGVVPVEWGEALALRARWLANDGLPWERVRVEIERAISAFERTRPVRLDTAEALAAWRDTLRPDTDEGRGANAGEPDEPPD
jgi:tetratricopeptide (TPR) repeat protein/tRNA A-37 threonylcarbamoyl transferase component Bud32